MYDDVRNWNGDNINNFVENYIKVSLNKFAKRDQNNIEIAEKHRDSCIWKNDNWYLPNLNSSLVFGGGY